jgi:mycothiol synthase
MAWEGDRLVALCWTKTHPGGVGEIYLIATDPEYQGRGIGRTVALEGLDYLSREKGSSTGMLYVDGANEAALKLYERMGFEVHHTDRAFGLVL